MTRIAVLYVESFGNPRKFAGTARRVAQRMPVLTVIGGRSPAGQRAAASHNAAAATPLATQEALFGQAGIIATTSLGELIDTAALLACQPLPGATGSRSCPTRAARACWPPTRAATTACRSCSSARPPGASCAGCCHRVPSSPGRWTPARLVTTDTFRACLEEVAADDGVDAILAVAVPTAISDLSAAVAAAVVSKPLAVALLDRAESVQRLKRLPVPQPPAGRARTPARRAPRRRRRQRRLIRGRGGGNHRRGGGCRHRSARLRRPGERGPRARPRGPLSGLARAAAGQGPRAERTAHGGRARPGHRVPGRLPPAAGCPEPGQPSWCPATASR